MRCLLLICLGFAAARVELPRYQNCAGKANTCAPCAKQQLIQKIDSTSADDCCAACKNLKGCAAWTLNFGQSSCHLKRAATATKEGNCTTGFLPVAPTPAPQPPDPSKPNILFLMCDSMDGRVLDPTSPVSKMLEMPNLRNLAKEGVNFVNTYAASPQCVPSRTTMFAGRHTHHIKAWSNGQGLAGIPSTGALDEQCMTLYSNETCRTWADQQKINATLFDALRENKYESHFYGKVDVGAGILTDWDEKNATCNGFHSGPTISILTRTADIRRPTKPDPISITNDETNNVHPEDWKMIPKCREFIRNYAKGQRRAQSHSEARRQELAESFGFNWMLYCSINIPHPAFKTNATWLKYVNLDKVQDKANLPVWPDESAFHPADSYMSISKNVWSNFTAADMVTVRKTYFAMCAETDYMLGTVVDALKETEQYNNTYIIFLSDHGEMNMEHRQVWKNSLYEASARVPMIIAGPNVRRGAVVKNLVVSG